MDAICSPRGIVPFWNTTRSARHHPGEFFLSRAANLPLHSVVEPVKISDDEVSMHESENTSAENSITPDNDSATGLSSPPSGPRSLTQQVAPWWHTILLLTVLVGMSVLGGVGAKQKQMTGHQVPTYVFTILFEWILLAFVWWGLRMRRTSLKSLMGERHKGWGWLGRDIGYAAVFWVLAYIVLAATRLLLQAMHIGKSALPAKVIALAPSTPLQFFLWFLVCVTAGICEEFIFRGYLLRQFSSLGGKVWLGVVISSLIFGASHGYEGLSVMIVIFVYGVLFCLLVLKSKSLRPGMIAHGWHDFITGIAVALLHHMHRI